MSETDPAPETPDNPDNTPGTPAPQAQKLRKDGKPRKKRATREQRKAIINHVAQLIACMTPDREVRQRLILRMGYSRGETNDLLSAARKLLRESFERDPAEIASESFAFYQSVIADATNSARDRINACNSIDRLLGLQKPLKVASTDPTGQYESLAQTLLRQKMVADDGLRDMALALAERLCGFEPPIPHRIAPEGIEMEDSQV